MNITKAIGRLNAIRRAPDEIVKTGDELIESMLSGELDVKKNIVTVTLQKIPTLDPSEYFHFIDADDFNTSDFLFDELMRPREQPYMIALLLPYDEFKHLPTLPVGGGLIHCHPRSEKINWDRIIPFLKEQFTMEKTREFVLEHYSEVFSWDSQMTTMLDEGDKNENEHV